MEESTDIDIPEEVKALFPDEVSSNFVSKEAQSAVNEMVEERESYADKMVEAAKKIPQAKVAINGIFKHPPEFTEEEWDIIVAGLRAHLPLYAIASRVNCERHFLSRKIQENKEVAQLVMDSKEGVVDEAEFQLVKAVRDGSLSATIYILDHLGQSRGYGEQTESKNVGEDVHISFGEIPQTELAEAKRIIAEANQKTTPTLAHELEEIETPKSVSAQDLALAEDMVKSIEKANAPAPIDVPSQVVDSAPYEQPAQHDMDNEKYDFLETAFAEGGDSPFGNF